MLKFEKGDKIQFVAVNGLFYSCNHLSRDKSYIIVEVANYGSFASPYKVMIQNDQGDMIRINNENFDNIQLLREQKLKDILDE